MPSTTVARLLERMVGTIGEEKDFLETARDNTRCEEDFIMRWYVVDVFESKSPASPHC